MLIKAQTRKGVLVNGTNEITTIRLDSKGLMYLDQNNSATVISPKDLLEVTISDIKSCETTYSLEGRELEWVNQADSLITVQVKNKFLRWLFIRLFKTYPK